MTPKFLSTPAQSGTEKGTMISKQYSEERKKARKLILLRTTPVRLRLDGFEPSPDMQPGKYKVVCDGAVKSSFARGLRIELRHKVIDGPHTGTALRQWIPVDASGVISSTSRYAKQCVIALGRPLEPEDNLDNPASIFTGRIFLAAVGFRKTQSARGGKTKPENALRRKDEMDRLRVHDLLSREEL